MICFYFVISIGDDDSVHVHISPASSTTLTYDDDVDGRDSRSKNRLQRAEDNTSIGGGRQCRSKSLDSKPLNIKVKFDSIFNPT